MSLNIRNTRRLNAVNREQLSLPAVRIAVPMAAGMLTAFFFDGAAAVIVMLILIPVAFYLAVKRNGLCICAVSALFGVVTMFVWIRAFAAPIAESAGKTIRTEVEITDIVPMRGGDFLFVARGEVSGRNAVMGLTSSGQLSEGQRIEATIKLSEPNADRTAFNLSNGILLDGAILKYTPVSYNGESVLQAVKHMRRSFFNELLSCGSGDARMLTQSMLLGMDNELSVSLEDNMRVCGASHYTAVSGTHFAVLASVLLELMSENRQKARSALSIAFAFAGILFFGPTKSVVRASTMFFTSGMAGFFRRRSDTLNSLCISVILITMFRPANILDVGFAMSVLGVFGAGVAGPRIAERLTAALQKRSRWLSVPVRVMTISASAVICTSPISAAIFGGVSATGAIVTVIIAPLITVAMASMLITGLTGLGVFAVPTEWSMRIAAAVIRFFGKQRWLYINMDFTGSWFFPLACAVMITVAAFGGIRLVKPMIRCTAISVLCAMILSQKMILERNEIRFVGNSVTSAAVVMRGSTAAVYISGSGCGLSESISQCLRAHGAVNIVCIAAPDADYSGSLSIRELSEIAEIEVIYANELTEKLIPEVSVVAGSENGTLFVNGVTIGSAEISNTERIADIVLYSGRALNPPHTSANLAVYFLPDEAEIPENGVNIRAYRDFKIQLTMDNG